MAIAGRLAALLVLWATVAGAQPTGGGPRLLLKDEGTPLTRITSLNCTGAGVTCSTVGVDGTINVTGGGGGGLSSCGTELANELAFWSIPGTTLCGDTDLIFDGTHVTLQAWDKGGGCFNPKAYGALGNDTGNDAPFIQAAADAAFAAGGGTVCLPGGVYRLSCGIELDDKVTFQGVGPGAVLHRDTTECNQTVIITPACTTAVANDATCATGTGGECQRAVIRNKRKDCSGTAIAVRDLAVNGDLFTTPLACVGVCQGPTRPAVAFVFSGTTDLLIDHVYFTNTPQDAVFIKNGGGRTVVSHVTVDGHNMQWGNGGGINNEFRTTGLIPGTVDISDNYVVSRGPAFCDADLSTSCTANTDCTACPNSGTCTAGFPAGCIGAGNPIACCNGAGTAFPLTPCPASACVGGTRDGKSCVGTNICGLGTSAATADGIALSWIDSGQEGPKGLVARNRLEVGDNHVGIVITGANGVTITENQIRAYDSGTALAKRFSGITATGSTTFGVGGRHLRDLNIVNNTILGGPTATAADRRAILIDDVAHYCTLTGGCGGSTSCVTDANCATCANTCPSSSCVGNVCAGGSRSGLACNNDTCTVNPDPPLSRNVNLRGNIIRDKNLASGLAAITYRGVGNGAIEGNQVRDLLAGLGIELGSGTTNTEDVLVQGNQVVNVTGATKDCLRLLNTTRVTVGGNEFQNCTPALNFQAATIAGTIILPNIYDTVATLLNQGTTDATLHWADTNVTSGSTLAILNGLTIANGSVRWCTDCKAGNPLICSTTGTGSIARRVNGAWVCGDPGVPAGNNGQVQYATTSSGSAIFDATSDFRYDATQRHLLVGNLTTPPNLAHVHTHQDAAVGGSGQHIFSDHYGTPVGGIQWLGRRAQGSESVPAPPNLNDELLNIGAAGHDGVGFTASKAREVFTAAETWTGSAQGTYTHWDQTLAGTTTRCERMRLTDKGALELRESMLCAGGSNPGVACSAPSDCTGGGTCTTCGSEHTGFRTQAQTANVDYILPAAVATVAGQTIVNGGGPSPQTLSWGAPTPGLHNFLDSTVHNNTLTGLPVRGDLIVANVTPAWARFPIGAANLALGVNAAGTTLEYKGAGTTTDFSGNQTVKLPTKADPGSPVTSEIWLSTTAAPELEKLKYRSGSGNTKSVIVSEGIGQGQTIKGGTLASENLDLHPNTAAWSLTSTYTGRIKLHGPVTFSDSFTHDLPASFKYIATAGTVTVGSGAIPAVIGYSHDATVNYTAAAAVTGTNISAAPAFSSNLTIAPTQAMLESRRVVWMGFNSASTWMPMVDGVTTQQFVGYTADPFTALGGTATAGTVNNVTAYPAYDFQVAATPIVGAGITAVNVRGSRIYQAQRDAAGVVKTQVGVDIEPLTNGTVNNWSLRSSGLVAELANVGPIASIQNVGGVTIAAVSTPAAPTVLLVTTTTTTTTTTFTGTTTTLVTTTTTTTTTTLVYTYKVVAKTATGATPASAGTSINEGLALGTSRFHRVSWAHVQGALSYDVYRTAGGATQGKLANVTIGGTDQFSGTAALRQDTKELLFEDVGTVAGAPTTPPAENTTRDLQNGGGMLLGRTATAVTYTDLVDDYVIAVTSTAAARTINLQPAATEGAGRMKIIKDESGAAVTNNITVDANGTETIDGALTKVINTNYGVLRLYSDGSNWFTW